jgi:putative PIN family toxin of toxin-antitoxin system
LLKACLDTNVWLSGLLFSGPPSEIVTLAFERKFQVVSSLFILEEIERILVQKFSYKLRAAKRFTFRIAQIADVYDPKGTVRVIEKHPDDNLVLETAWIGRAKYLVTGDKEHILPVKIFRNIKIIEPAKFLPLIKK